MIWISQISQWQRCKLRIFQKDFLQPIEQKSQMGGWNIYWKICLMFSSQELLPLFSLIRDFQKQNTCRNVSKISVNHACYRQIGSKPTNHSPPAWCKEGLKVTLVQCFSQKILLEGQSGPWRLILGANFLGKGPTRNNWLEIVAKYICLVARY